jgi:hypothetical protein
LQKAKKTGREGELKMGRKQQKGRITVPEASDWVLFLFDSFSPNSVSVST